MDTKSSHGWLLLEKSFCGVHRGGLWFKLAKWTEISKKQQESTTHKQISTKISTYAKNRPNRPK